MDVTPRPLDVTPAPTSTRRRPGAGTRRRKWVTLGVLALVAVAAGFLMKQALGEATTYYYNVDEAVAQRAEIGDRTIRIQGTVTEASTPSGEGSTRFTLAFSGQAVDVVHTGATPALFKEGQPVVSQGRFDGDVFRSDEIQIKHSETYREENPERVPQDAPEAA